MMSGRTKSIHTGLRHCFGLIALALPLLAHAGLPESSSVPGGIAIIPLGSATPTTARPQTWLGEQQVLVTSDRNEWYAVVGLPLDTTPGSHALRVRIGNETRMQAFDVNPKKYPEQDITLKDKSKVELSPADLARALREIARIHKLEHHWRAAQQTDLDFVMPAKGPLGGRFGVRRVFNGEPRSPHSGLDVVVPRGTPVRSAAAGTVLAVGNFFFNGKTVFVDHGNGLITLYCHLSRISVRPGQAVRKGQRIALSGMTGRATGPHLHWSVVLNGTMVDPELFVPAIHQR
jgi:murein DD-endopeptidase MepM/ murein hydrolase activator NlpD